MTSDGGQGLGDFSMLDLFRAEIESHTPVLNEGLLVLEKDPAQTKRLEALMRAAHSIKGAARIVGVDAAVHVAHVMEDFFVAAQAGRVPLGSDAIDLLLRGVDTLAQIGQHADAGLGDWLAVNGPAFQRFVEEVAALSTGRPAPAAGPADGSPPADAPEGAGPPTVQPAGDLDAAAAEALRRELIGFLTRGVTHLRLDLSQVREVEPAGLAVLAVLARTAAARGVPATLEVAGAGPDLLTLFRLTRLDHAYRLPGPSAAATSARGGC